ncbi:MAG: phosphonoacetaldehyde hydrolase [Rhodospirillales bacterium 20-64-7]|nr:MAG: phosphonoacetaldehyde hydrolase [Rhodospirillales bacterium 20-64-7]
MQAEVLKAVILDWAGTVVDFGSRAPMGAFVRAFKEFGVDISIAEARGPMGMAKWDHIRTIGQSEAVAAAWRVRHGRDFNEDDVSAIFEVFEPMNIASAADHAGFIPGAVAALDELRGRGLRLGSTTGYTRAIMDVVEPIAAAGGYAPEIVVCAGDLSAGRPSPLMMWYAMARMGVWPAASVVKVDDTPIGIEEGVNAGTWTIGVALSGNMCGLPEAELLALTNAERADIRNAAAVKLRAAGADIVIDSIAELPGACEKISSLILAGERPAGHD